MRLMCFALLLLSLPATFFLQERLALAWEDKQRFEQVLMSERQALLMAKVRWGEVLAVSVPLKMYGRDVRFVSWDVLRDFLEEHSGGEDVIAFGER